MVSTNIKDVYKYNFYDEKFRIAFEFLKTEDLSSLEPGEILLADGVKVSVQFYDTQDASQLKWESHERYFDIQYVIDGEEIVQTASRSGFEISEKYNPERDITFYKDGPLGSSVLLHGGDYVILAPEDVHKPRCKTVKNSPVKKIVIKVPV